MEYYKSILCISYTELIQGNPSDADVVKRPIMTEANFKYYKSREKFRVLRRACYGTPSLVAYSSLPTPIKEKVVAKYGNLERARNYILKDMIVKDIQAENFYAGYTFNNKGIEQLKVEKQKEYTMNASVLNAIIMLVSDRSLFIKGLNGSTLRVWPEISQELNMTQEEVGCKLPRNHTVLKRIVEKYKTGGYASLISGKFCNNNARKNKKFEQEALIVELLGDGRNIDNETVSKLYNAVAARMGWKTISPSTVANYKNEHMECYAGRHGKKALMNEKLMQVKRTAPTCPMYFWCVDGWDTELFYQKKSVNDKGHQITTYHHRPTVVAIVDPFNKYIIGYAIGTNETPLLIRQAFRNAFEHVRELFGAYYKPWQIQTDNYGRGNLKSFYEACTYYYTPASVGNAKAKIIEPFFNTFNRKYLRLLPNSSGHGVKSRREIQVSDDWIEAHKRHFPDYIGCCSQLEKMIEFDRNTKRDAFIAKWSEMAHDKHLPFDKKDFLSAFGEVAEPRKLNGDGVRLQVNGQKFWYDCFDPAFREYGHATFFLRYDPSDMDNVLAIENIGTSKVPEEGVIRFLLERKYEQPMALMDRKPGDMDELTRIRNYNDDMIGSIILKRKQAAETVQQLFEQNNEQLKDTLTAHVITDSLGQHKNRRNEIVGRTQNYLQEQTLVTDDDNFEMVVDEQEFLKEF